MNSCGPCFKPKNVPRRSDCINRDTLSCPRNESSPPLRSSSLAGISNFERGLMDRLDGIAPKKSPASNLPCSLEKSQQTPTRVEERTLKRSKQLSLPDYLESDFMKSSPKLSPDTRDSLKSLSGWLHGNVSSPVSQSLWPDLVGSPICSLCYLEMCTPDKCIGGMKSQEMSASPSSPSTMIHQEHLWSPMESTRTLSMPTSRSQWLSSIGLVQMKTPSPMASSSNLRMDSCLAPSINRASCDSPPRMSLSSPISGPRKRS